MLMKFFIHGLSPTGGIVADMTVSTCIISIIQLLVYMFRILYFNIHIFIIVVLCFLYVLLL